MESESEGNCAKPTYHALPNELQYISMSVELISEFDDLK